MTDRCRRQIGATRFGPVNSSCSHTVAWNYGVDGDANFGFRREPIPEGLRRAAPGRERWPVRDVVISRGGRASLAKARTTMLHAARDHFFDFVDPADLPALTRVFERALAREAVGKE